MNWPVLYLIISLFPEYYFHFYYYYRHHYHRFHQHRQQLLISVSYSISSLSVQLYHDLVLLLFLVFIAYWLIVKLE